MTKAAIAADLHEALDVLADLAAKVTLDLQVPVDVLAKPDDLFFGEVADARVRADTGLAQNLLAGRETDAVDVGQADLDALLAREVDTCDTGHACSPPSPAAACDAGSRRSRGPGHGGG